MTPPGCADAVSAVRLPGLLAARNLAEQDLMHAASHAKGTVGSRTESAGRLWIVLLALVLCFRPCLRGFAVVRA